MFSIVERKGFHIKFSNNLVVSVQFGKYNYCQNRDGVNGAPSETAEVAVFDDHSGEFITQQFTDSADDVAGWQTPEQVAVIMNKVANWQPTKQE